MFKTLLALLIFATASLAVPSVAAAKSHGNQHVSSLMKKHKHEKHKHKPQEAQASQTQETRWWLRRL
jgi:hypothetical protein